MTVKKNKKNDKYLRNSASVKGTDYFNVETEACSTKKNADPVGKSARRKKTLFTIVKFAILVAIVVGIPIYVFLFHRDFINNFRTVESVQKLFEHYRSESVMIYFGGQILQIIIAAIPGQALQIVAGYFFGFFRGLLWSVAGVLAGTVITFYLARLLGQDAMYLIFGEEKLKKFIEKLNSKKAYTVVFILYLIPGLPKDIFNYAVGLSEMNFKAFLILSTIGRIPGMTGSLAVGFLLVKKSYTALIILCTCVIICAIFAFIFRKKLKGWLDRFYERIKE